MLHLLEQLFVNLALRMIAKMNISHISLFSTFLNFSSGFDRSMLYTYHSSICTPNFSFSRRRAEPYDRFFKGAASFPTLPYIPDRWEEGTIQENPPNSLPNSAIIKTNTGAILWRNSMMLRLLRGSQNKQTLQLSPKSPSKSPPKPSQPMSRYGRPIRPPDWLGKEPLPDNLG